MRSLNETPGSLVAVSTVVPPRCGLYRTTRPLRDGADEVPAGVLVNLHTHDEPVVHLPRYSSFNRWAWERVPHRVRERGWLESLRALGLRPVVTLHHFTNPPWLEAQGG